MKTQHLRDLEDLQSCVDNVECTCLDPPFDRGENPDKYETHSQYCPEYLFGYIGKLIENCQK